jgi:hypothetical protein|tara:strand:+ start:438 stop:1307 length:870 start_codon:yes stop_codon:yes gene_type:complete
MSKEDLVLEDQIEDITSVELQNDEALVEDVEVDEETLAEDSTEELEAEIEFDFTEDLDALTAEEATLSEGFKGKAQIIFEAAIKSKMSSEIDRLEESYGEKLAEETTTIREDLTSKINDYLTYVVENWMEDNKLAVEKGIRTEIAENFMSALQTTFKEHYIEVPEGKEDMFDEIVNKADDLEEQLSEAVDKSIALKKANVVLERAARFTDIAEGLTANDTEKLRDLTKDIDFDSVEQFSEKVSTIKEAYFKEAKLEVMTDSVEDTTDETEEVEISVSMQRYVNAMKQSQ